MPSCLSLFGGKGRGCREFGLHQFIPPLTNNKIIYTESFFGTGVMFFQLPQCRTAVLNDKLDLIWNFWKVVKEQSHEFEDEIKFVWVGKKYFDEYKKREDPIGKAVYFYLMNRNSHKGIMEDTFRYKSFIHPLTKNFQPWAEKLNSPASLTIFNSDFREVYNNLMGNGSKNYSYVWYSDPPYYQQDRYMIQFSEQDHLDLAKLHNEMKENPYHHLIISYNDCKFIRDLYKGWEMKSVEWSQGSLDNHEENNKELLISNRPLIRYTTNGEVIKTYQNTNLGFALK